MKIFRIILMTIFLVLAGCATAPVHDTSAPEPVKNLSAITPGADYYMTESKSQGGKTHALRTETLPIVRDLEAGGGGVDVDFIWFDMDSNSMAICGDHDGDGTKECGGFWFANIMTQLNEGWQNEQPIDAINVEYEMVLRLLKEAIMNSAV